MCCYARFRSCVGVKPWQDVPLSCYISQTAVTGAIVFNCWSALRKTSFARPLVTGRSRRKMYAIGKIERPRAPFAPVVHMNPAVANKPPTGPCKVA
jgi:hypothetical protein